MTQTQGNVVDYSSLYGPVSAAEINAVAPTKASAQFMRKYKWWFLFAGPALLLLGSLMSMASSGAGAFFLGLGFMVFPIGALLTIALLYNERLLARSARIARFAARNGMMFAREDDPAYNRTGMIFSMGYQRSAQDIIYKLSDTGERLYEAGTWQFMTGSGKNRQVHSYEFMALDMNRNLPHMVLDAHANNMKVFGKTFSEFSQLDKSQVIDLEGDFGKYFTLYGPVAYQSDARYIFTPDVMALLIDNATAYDGEVVNDKVYFFRKTSSISTGTAPKSLEQRYMRALNLIGVMGPKLLKQTGYYADERVGSRAIDQVAVEGRRLKRKIPTFAIVAIVLWVAYMLFALVQSIVNSTQ